MGELETLVALELLAGLKSRATADRFLGCF